MTYYTSIRLIDSKPRKVIVNEAGKIVNRNPSKDELKGIEKEIEVPYSRNNKTVYKYADKELLDYLRQFENEHERIPVRRDFENNPGYPGFSTYVMRFGSWSNALKLVELDVESMIKKGKLETTNQKARLAEIIVRDHFKQHPIDLAGENQGNPCDGICPNGKTYDVKSSGLLKDRDAYNFMIKNKYKEEIEIYYLLAFNYDYTNLEYAWRIPGEIVEKNNFIIYIHDHSKEFNTGNMKEYDITDRLRDVINKRH